MDKAQFKDLAGRIIADIPATFTLLARHPDRGVIPVGLALIEIKEERSWLHFEWFWWASRRNKLESAVKFIDKYRDDLQIFAAVPRKSTEERFCERLKVYGVMWRIGTSEHWDGPTALYETRDS